MKREKILMGSGILEALKTGNGTANINGVEVIQERDAFFDGDEIREIETLADLEGLTPLQYLEKHGKKLNYYLDLDIWNKIKANAPA